MPPKPESIDAYLEVQTDEMRPVLEHLRTVITGLVPEATETISYGLPTFKHRGKPLAYFGAAKNHLALYGLGAGVDPSELAAYDTSGKGTIRFTPALPLPDDLLRRLIEGRKTELDARRGEELPAANPPRAKKL